MSVLSSAEIAAELESLTGWRMEGGKLVRDFSFTDFREAMSFVNAVAVIAEKAGHHPDMDIRYNKVRLAVVSHDAGGITKKDVSLANQVGGIL